MLTTWATVFAVDRSDSSGTDCTTFCIFKKAFLVSILLGVFVDDGFIMINLFEYHFYMRGLSYLLKFLEEVDKVAHILAS